MGAMFSLETYRKIYRFLGPKVTGYLLIGIVFGVLLFAVEFAFAFTLQAFLAALGIVPPGSVTIPAWLPQGSLPVVLGFIFVVGVARACLQWGHFYFSQMIAEVIRIQQRSRLAEWGFRSPSASSGRVMTLFNETTTAVSVCVSNLQTVAVYFTAAILLWTCLVSIAPRITLYVTVAVVVIGLLMRLLDKVIKSAGQNFSDEVTRINNRILSGIKNLLLIQIYGTERREIDALKSSMDTYYSQMRTYVSVSAIKYVLPQVIGVAVICSIAWSAAKTGEIAPAMLISYFYLFIRFVQTLSETAKTTAVFTFVWPQAIQMARWWADESFDGIRNRRPSDAGAAAPEPLAQPVGWELDNVSLAYAGTDTLVLKNLSLSIQPGELFAVTGESGSGKSTLLSLLLGGLEPTAGTIAVVGGSGGRVERARLLRSLGYVGPESFMIEGTVLENLCYGLVEKPSAAEVKEALKKAKCDFVFQMGAGLEHRLTEQGQGLSAGQKQRLGLARALLRKPKVLLLDEATANLDRETEAELVESLASLKRNITIVAVTHREALLTIADRVLQLENHAPSGLEKAPN